MAIPIQNTTTTNTFDFWRNRTNEMAQAFTNSIVTTDSNPSSVAATGNAAITGKFTANSFYANGVIMISNSMSNATITTTSFFVGNNSVSMNVSTGSVTFKGQPLVVGNSSVNAVINATSFSIANGSSNLSITLPSNTIVEDGGYYLNANGSWMSIGGALAISVNTLPINLSAKTVDTFDRTKIRAAEYLISIVDTSANNRQTAKILLTHDDGYGYVTEYAQHVSNTLLGNFTSSIVGTSVVLTLNLTGTSTANVKFTRIAL